MDRFMGMMPSSEVEINKTLIDDLGFRVTVQAGPNGWTILYADSSSEYRDVVDTSENNFNAALAVLNQNLGDMASEGSTEDDMGECMCDCDGSCEC
jgi:hypothetical protein